jgi:hypothetical protein
MPTRPTSVSVTEPLSPALHRVKTVLFAPFDINKWFIIGFCAWLSSCGENGGGGGGGGGPGRSGRSGSGDSAREVLGKAWDYFLANAYWIVPVIVLVFLLCAGIWLLATWLNSRGKFMLLHCVALNCAEVKIPWAKYGTHANSLFWFQACLGVLSFFLIFPVLIAGVFVLLRAVVQETPLVEPFILLGLAVLWAIAIGITVAIIKKLLLDFVVPIMYLRTASVRAAWREFMDLGRENPGRIVLYLLFSLLLAMLIGMGILVLVLITCCIAGCLMAIPYIGAVLLLPVYVFKRAYPLCYLEQ